MKQIVLISAAVLLASCNREDQPQAPTAAESERLNEAEEMLNDLAKEEGPAPQGTGPSNRSE
jgi:hypothetical protein